MNERDQLLKQSLKSGLTTGRQKCTSLRNKVIKNAKTSLNKILQKMGSQTTDSTSQQKR